MRKGLPSRLWVLLNELHMKLAVTCHTQLQSGACLTKKCDCNMSKSCFASVRETIWTEKEDCYVALQYWNCI